METQAQKIISIWVKFRKFIKGEQSFHLTIKFPVGHSAKSCMGISLI